MVGVPGRSKGCNTCRQRRVKCGEEKPHCKRCIKAGFPCAGYARETIWRHTSTAPFAKTEAISHVQPKPASPKPLTSIATITTTLQKPRPVKTAQAPARTLSSILAPASSVPGQCSFLMMTAPEPMPEQRQEPHPQEEQQQALLPMPIPGEIHFRAFQPDMVVSFMRSNFMWRTFGAGWFDQAAEGKLGQLAYDAVMAHCEANFAWSYGQTDLKNHSSNLYTSCLGRMSQEINKHVTTKTKRNTLVVPALLLMSYASSEGLVRERGLHLGGIARLLPMCGPKMFRKQPLLNAFESCRATLVTANLNARRRLFLEEEQWRSVPWELDPPAKSQSSRIIDVLVTVPGLLEDHYKLYCLQRGSQSTTGLGSPPAFPPAFATPTSPCSTNTSATTDYSALYEELLAKLSNQLEELYLWRWRWQITHGLEVQVDIDSASDMTWSTDEPQFAAAANSPYVQPLKFTRFSAATEIMLYNATLMWLIALLWKLAPDLARDRIKSCGHKAMLAATSFAATPPPCSHTAFSPPDFNSQFQSPPPFASNFPPFHHHQPIPDFIPLRGPGQPLSLRDLAIEIGRVFQWVSCNRDRDDNTELNPLCMFPVGMAKSVLDSDPVGQSWIQDMLETSPLTENYGGGGRSTSGEEGNGQYATGGESSQGHPGPSSEASGTQRARPKRLLAGFEHYVTDKALDPGPAQT